MTAQDIAALVTPSNPAKDYTLTPTRTLKLRALCQRQNVAIDAVLALLPADVQQQMTGHA